MIGFNKAEIDSRHWGGRCPEAEKLKAWNGRTVSFGRPTRSCARHAAYFAMAELDRRSKP
jgi:hypothetical protein